MNATSVHLLAIPLLRYLLGYCVITLSVLSDLSSSTATQMHSFHRQLLFRRDCASACEPDTDTLAFARQRLPNSYNPLPENKKKGGVIGK